MRVMTFWVNEIGSDQHNIFHQRTNLHYGCTILRYYLGMENGSLYRALGRYNGSLGKPRYPNLVKSVWQKHGGIPQRTASTADQQVGRQF